MNSFFAEIQKVFRKGSSALYQLIAINAVVFIVLGVLNVISTLFSFSWVYELAKAQLVMPAAWYALLLKPWTIITTFFFHEGIYHILINMLVMFWFGQIIQEYLGNRRVTALYVMGGLAGGLLYLVGYNSLPILVGIRDSTYLLGASGAVYALVVAAATLVPNYTFHVFFLGPVRIAYIAGFYVLLSFLELKGGNTGGNLAHLGGALFGFVFVKQLRAGNDLGKPLNALLAWISNVFAPKGSLRVSYKEPVAATKRAKATTAVAGSSSAPMPDQEEVDAILDKISKIGYENLSREEKQKLFSASQKS